MLRGYVHQKVKEISLASSSFFSLFLVRDTVQNILLAKC